MTAAIDESARIVNSTVGESELREYVTIHDSELGDDCRVYERTSLKKCRLGNHVDVNAGAYVENAEIDDRVQIGPNCTVVGVTHALTEDGMDFRNDVFERIILHEDVFVGAGAVVAPGVEIAARTVVAAGAIVAHDIGPEAIVIGAPPAQRVTGLRDRLDR